MSSARYNASRSYSTPKQLSDIMWKKPKTQSQALTKDSSNAGG